MFWMYSAALQGWHKAQQATCCNWLNQKFALSANENKGQDLYVSK